jgi:hypothetical protein
MHDHVLWRRKELEFLGLGLDAQFFADAAGVFSAC